MTATLFGRRSGTAAVDVGALYERHAPEIHDFLVRTVRDPATAEDLTQTTFVRLMERGESVREAEKVRPWLFTVAHNLAVTHVTRRRPSDPIEAAFDIASGDKGPEDEALAIAAATLVWDAAASLEPRQYAVLDLSVRRGLSVGEIAEVLEITPAHAAVVVHRAREALAQAIRLLVVVRQRRHCARLAELVPAGTDILTPDLRASVDRHMRRCEVCREVGDKLTQPAELFAALPLLPLPLALHAPPVVPHAVVPHRVAGLHHLASRAGETLMQPVALATMAALAVVGTGVGVALHHGGGSSSTPPAAENTGRHAGPGTAPGSSGGGAEAVVPQDIAGPAGVLPPPQDSGSTEASTGTAPSGDQTPGDSGSTPPTADTPQAPPASPPPVPPPSGPKPLLDQWIGPVSTPAGPVGAHATVYQPGEGNPSVTVVLPGQAAPAAKPAAGKHHTLTNLA